MIIFTDTERLPYGSLLQGILQLLVGKGLKEMYKILFHTPPVYIPLDDHLVLIHPKD